MAEVDQSFEEFRRDLIAHLSAHSGLAPDIVASHLPAWLLHHAEADADADWRALPAPPQQARH